MAVFLNRNLRAWGGSEHRICIFSFFINRTYILLLPQNFLKKSVERLFRSQINPQFFLHDG